MGSLRAQPNPDDNMGFCTPNFFSSAWNQEQDDFSFCDNQGILGGYDNYVQNFALDNRANEQCDYLSSRREDQFVGHQGYPAGISQDQSGDEIGRVLTPGLSFLNMDLDPVMEKALAGQTSYPSQNQVASPQSMQQYSAALVFGQDGLEALPASHWSPNRMSQGTKTQLLENSTARKTAVMQGQLTPGASPQDEDPIIGRVKLTVSPEVIIKKETKSQSTSAKRSVASESEVPSTSHEIISKPAKKARKSKKKTLTKDQEDVKRKRFLERNRVAADKCRQNRKKWIDDLQERCHDFGADNAVKKMALEEMEQELMQVKNMLLMHSHTCKDDDLLSWIGQESKKMPDSQPEHQFATVTSPQSQTTSSTPASTPLNVKAELYISNAQCLE